MRPPPIPTHLTDLEFTRVLSTYVLVVPLARDKRVLDAGCGAGHGSWLMRERGARAVVAVDLDPANIELISRISRECNGIHGAIMDVQALALADARSELVTCFEVIEHVPDPGRLLAELRRVAVPDALTLVSTPNREVRLGRGEPPWDPEHVREYDLTGLQRTLERAYRCVEVLGIYGREGLHIRYLNEWRPTLRRRVRGMVWRAIPAGARALVRAAIRARPVRERVDAWGQMPPLDAREWPFHLAAVGERCLNFLAVCGDEERAVRDAARTLLAQRA